MKADDVVEIGLAPLSNVRLDVFGNQAEIVTR